MSKHTLLELTPHVQFTMWASSCEVYSRRGAAVVVTRLCCDFALAFPALAWGTKWLCLLKGVGLIWQGNALKRDRWFRWLILKHVSIKADGDASAVTFLDTVVCSAVTCSCFYSSLGHSLSATSSTTSPLLLFPHQRSLTDYLPVNPTWSQWEAGQICNITTQLLIQN